MVCNRSYFAWYVGGFNMSLFDNPDNAPTTEQVSKKFRKGQMVNFFNGATRQPARIVNLMSGGEVEIEFQSSRGDRAKRVVHEDELFPTGSKMGAIKRVFKR